MNAEQLLQNEIKDSQRWIEVEKDESTYKCNLKKRVELINWVLEEMKIPDIFICEIIESKMNEIIDKINKTHDIFVADLLHSELQILDCVLCKFVVTKLKG